MCYVMRSQFSIYGTKQSGKTHACTQMSQQVERYYTYSMSTPVALAAIHHSLLFDEY